MKSLVKKMACLGLFSCALSTQAGVIITDKNYVGDALPEGELRIIGRLDRLEKGKKYPLLETNDIDTIQHYPSYLSFWTSGNKYWSGLGLAAKDANGRMASCFIGLGGDERDLLYYNETRDMLNNAGVGVRYEILISAQGECKSVSASKTGVR